MELTKVEIENYKSIKSPVTISFLPGLPTVLIGKNGSGKSTVLEALNAIAEANQLHSYGREREDIEYRAYIRLSEEDVKAILPDLVYDESRCEIMAYGYGKQMKIDRIQSDYIVPSFKREIADISQLADELELEVVQYEKNLAKIAHDEYQELPIHGYVIKFEDGGLTNYSAIQWDAEHFLETIRKSLEEMKTAIRDDDREFVFGADSVVLRYLSDRLPRPFRLEYREPSLAKFEQKYITINTSALKREITRINKATKKSRDAIERLMGEINERIIRVHDGMTKEDRLYDAKREKDEKYERFLTQVRQIIGRKCLFLRNENNDLLFSKRGYDPYVSDHSRQSSILETYLRHVYQGEDRDQLLRSRNEKKTLPDRALADFEAYLNAHLPAFDKGMYDSVSVESDEQGQFSVYLNENTGERVNLNETSAGRRWYFSYYFMKNLLDEGDIFIIDEPAATLHPGAQREVLAELTELVRRGIKVVYSTHSPYLIPKEWQCVHCVTMTEEGTRVNGSLSDGELVSHMREIVGNDIFDVTDLISKYEACDIQKITANARTRILAIQKERGISNQQEACAQIGISLDTLKSWGQWPYDCHGNENKKFHEISLENLIKVLKWAKLRFEDLLDR